MPRSLDPAIVALVPDPVKRTNFIVKLEAPVVRRFTPYPDGLTVDGEFYEPLHVECEGVVDSIDAPAWAATLTFANANGIVSDLARDAANLRKVVSVWRVHFDADWKYAAKELFFRGETGAPQLRGGYLTLGCGVRDGRKGQSPFREWGEVMTAHRPPDSSTRIPWVRK